MTDQRERLSLTVGNEVRAAPTGETASERAGRSAEPGPQDASSGWIPAAGRVIDNPISGERIVIRESGAQTGGQLLSFDLFLPPRAHVPARHVHPVRQIRQGRGRPGARPGRCSVRRSSRSPRHVTGTTR